MISERYSKGEHGERVVNTLRVHGKNWAHRTFQGLKLFDCSKSKMYDWIMMYILKFHI